MFDKRPFPAARQAAGEQQKWLIVNVSIKGNPNAEKTGARVWSDPAVATWVRAHAIAVFLDANRDVKQSHALRADPYTIVALKNGSEVGRFVACESSKELLTWFDAIERGLTPRQYYEERLKEQRRLESERQAREARSSQLMVEERYAEAAEDFAWLWRNGTPRAVRLSFTAAHMREAAAKSKDARRLFQSLRDEAAKPLSGPVVSEDDVLDWIVLNDVLADERATLDWYQKTKDDPRLSDALQSAQYRLEPLFISHKMWRDVGRWMRPDPVQSLELDAETIVRSVNSPIGNEEERAGLREFMTERFRTRNSARYAGLLAAGREDEGRAFAERLRQIDGSFDMLNRLISTVLDAGVVRAEHVDWVRGLKGAEAANLRTQVEAALTSRKPLTPTTR